MKKLVVITMVMITIVFTGCATVFGGHISECQRTKPLAGQPSRQVRVIALICDIVLFWPGAVIDFADNAIYKPCNTPPARHY